MSTLKYTTYPGYGVWAQSTSHISQAVRTGSRILCSGQGGWNPNPTPDKPYDPSQFSIPDDVAEEIAQAFENVDLALKEAGGKGWSQVYKITTLSTDAPGQLELIVGQVKKWLPGHSPVWTAIGVKELALKEMRFEIEVEAWDGE